MKVKYRKIKASFLLTPTLPTATYGVNAVSILHRWKKQAYSLHGSTDLKEPKHSLRGRKVRGITIPNFRPSHKIVDVYSMVHWHPTPLQSPIWSHFPPSPGEVPLPGIPIFSP